MLLLNGLRENYIPTSVRTSNLISWYYYPKYLVPCPLLWYFTHILGFISAVPTYIPYHFILCIPPFEWVTFHNHIKQLIKWLFCSPLIHSKVQGLSWTWQLLSRARILHLWFITMFMKAQHWTLSWASWIQSISHCISLRYISCYPSLYASVFKSSLPLRLTKTVYEFLNTLFVLHVPLTHFTVNNVIWRVETMKRLIIWSSVP